MDMQATARPTYGFKACRRCGGDLDLNDDFPVCLQCGGEDYGRPLVRRRIMAKGWSGSSCRLPYVGGNQLFGETSLRGDVIAKDHARVTAASVRLRCPYENCRGSMGWSGGRKPLRREDGLRRDTFRCGQRHVVYLVTLASQPVGWE